MNDVSNPADELLVADVFPRASFGGALRGRRLFRGPLRRVRNLGVLGQHLAVGFQESILTRVA